MTIEHAINLDCIQNINTTAQIYREKDSNKADVISFEYLLWTFNLVNCMKTLHEVYNINEKENLIVIKLDFNRTEAPTNGIGFLIYTMDGVQLNTSYCVQVESTVPLIYLDKETLYLGKRMDKKGIDIFNSFDNCF